MHRDTDNINTFAPIASKVEIDYVNYKGERGIRTITPAQLAFGSTQYHPELQWMLSAVDAEKGYRSFAMRDIRRWGAWNEVTERKLFEDACWDQYLKKRATRAAQGVVSAFDKSAEESWTREELFALDGTRQYVALVYRGAWYGWKLARGG